jgi:hypothetical protein
MLFGQLCREVNSFEYLVFRIAMFDWNLILQGILTVKNVVKCI